MLHVYQIVQKDGTAEMFVPLISLLSQPFCSWCTHTHIHTPLITCVSSRTQFRKLVLCVSFQLIGSDSCWRKGFEVRHWSSCSESDFCSLVLMDVRASFHLLQCVTLWASVCVRVCVCICLATCKHVWQWHSLSHPSVLSTVCSAMQRTLQFCTSLLMWQI